MRGRLRAAVYCLLPTAYCLLTVSCANLHPVMVVAVPVADLRAQPGTSAQPDIHDPLEESQLLYGERVRFIRREGDWWRVEALEQPEYTHRARWQGYPGWVTPSVLAPRPTMWQPNVVVTDKWATTWGDPDALSPSPWRFALGTRLKAIKAHRQLWQVELLDGSVVWLPQHAARSLTELRALPIRERRQLILRNAQELLGDRYYWGGRSPRPSASTGRASGVDCSGLVNLAYRAAGIDIPRDAHEQFVRSHPILTPQAADLIFLSDPQHPRRIVHVMLYAGDGDLIEAPSTGSEVRRISVKDRLGQPLATLTPGTVVNGQAVFFGTYLP